MANVNSGRCTECDEEGIFTDGSICARCLSLVPVVDEDLEDEIEAPEELVLLKAA